MKKILFVVFALFSVISAQSPDPYAILNSVRDRFNQIQDYEVEATITVDVNFLKVPESHAKIFFKQPNKVKMESEGFALLPKQGLNFSPSQLLQGDYTAIYTKSDLLESTKVDVIKVIPNNDSSGVILSTLYVDSENKILRRIESTTKNTGTLEVDLKYESTEQIGLPSEVKFSFKVGDLNIPSAISGEMEDDYGKKGKKNKSMTGTVTVYYKNYKINNNLPDSLFDKLEKKH